MKKSLLILVAAFMVALSANAQVKRSAQTTKVDAPTAVKLTVEKAPALNLMETAKAHRANKSAVRRAVTDVAGSYILDYYNFDGDFCSSSSFTITAETGTIKAYNVETDEEDIDFEYNVRLDGFSYDGGVAYGYYYEEDGFIYIPVQTIATNKTYGRVVLSGVTSVDGTPAHIGFDINILVEEDGTLSIYGAEEELAEAGYDAGEAITGWYSFLPDYDFGGWNFGFEIEFFPINGYMSGYEVHIENGAWGNWTRTNHDVYVEDYDTELVVHNFFDLCPISITIDGDKASIATPVRVSDYDYADEGEEPNYMQIWQWDADFEHVVVPGAITGNVSIEEDGTKVIEFYDTEYKEAWTDEDGTEHEAGNYVIRDLTKYFMVHSTYGESGAYFWGEAQMVYIVIPNPSVGINELKVNGRNNMKTYNMMGQQVSPTAKGLLIRDGRKFINK